MNINGTMKWPRSQKMHGTNVGGFTLDVPIGRTYSCQASSKFPCGACPNCVERLNALSEFIKI